MSNVCITRPNEDAEIVGVGETVGATTANLITYDLGSTPGTYEFEARVKGFESTTPASIGGKVFGTFRTDGATATLVGFQNFMEQDIALLAADAYFVASGNNAILQVLGVAGLTIDWEAQLEVT